MVRKLLQMLSVFFSVCLAGAYVYMASNRKGMDRQSVNIAPDQPTASGPVFSSDLDMIPGTKSFPVFPAEFSNTEIEADPKNNTRSAAVQHPGPRYGGEFEVISSTKSDRIDPRILASLVPFRDEDEDPIFLALENRSAFSIRGQTLREIVKTFSETYKIPIVIHEASFQKENKSADEPISLDLPEMTLRSALKLILLPRELTYVVQERTLKIMRVDVIESLSNQSNQPATPAKPTKKTNSRF